METESEFNETTTTMNSPSSRSPKLKRLKKMNASASPKSDGQHRLEDEESDGLDPLFSGLGVKRALEFSGPEYDVDHLFDLEMESLGLRDEIEGVTEKKTKNTKRKRKIVGDKRVSVPKVSKRKENQERKAYLAQQADFQRIMRERKSVGFKPIPMIEKPISSVLQKIRQRKIELSKKFMSDGSKEEVTVEIKSVADDSDIDVSVKEIVEDQSCSSVEKSRSTDILVETVKSCRAPVDDTQDLFSDSEESDSQENPSNEESRNPVEDVSPSLPSLNLRIDSVLPDEISSDEEESDKENTVPIPKPSRKDSFSVVGDPVKEFLDEEALEDDSDNDLLPFEDKDEENDEDLEEHCDYIASDFKEKPIDLERRNQLHQTWLEQQDEAGTENLLQKLKYGGKQQEPTFLEVEDDDDGGSKDVGDESDAEDASDSEDDGSPVQTTTRATTKMLKQMIPQMFTDKDDVYVSSEDEESKRSSSRENKLREMGKEWKTKLLSAVEDDSSKEVLGRIRKLNSLPETKKKTKTPSFFDALLTKGSNCNSNKSSFLRRASSNPLPSSKRPMSNTGKSYIFERDDSRSSAPLIEESRVLETENQAKKVVTAKFCGSQVKRCSQETQTTGDQVSGTSLFEILKRSSARSSRGTSDDMVDQEAVFASFKSVKKQIRVDRRF